MYGSVVRCVNLHGSLSFALRQTLRLDRHFEKFPSLSIKMVISNSLEEFVVEGVLVMIVGTIGMALNIIRYNPGQAIDEKIV